MWALLSPSTWQREPRARAYALPAGTAAATYTIQAVYNGTANFQGSTDATHQLKVNAASTTTAAANASAIFSAAIQTVALNATLSSPAGTVNEGTETFTILNGTTVIGSPVMVDVTAGTAGAVYNLPAGAAAINYTIQAVYNGTSNFLSSSDNSHNLTVHTADRPTTAGAASTSASFSVSTQSVSLSVTITSSAGIVSEGTETFTILNGTTAFGGPVTVNVTNGSASADYPLPAGTPAGSYIIQAVYSGTANFLGFTDTTQHVTIAAATSATAAASTSATFDGASQSVTLTATITSTVGTVNEGTETFTILNGTTAIGSPVTVNVTGTGQCRLSSPGWHPRRDLHHPVGLQRDQQLPWLHRYHTARDDRLCRISDGRRDCLSHLQAAARKTSRSPPRSRVLSVR